VVPSTGLSFAVGDEITVDVLDSDPARRRIELGFVEKGAQDAERRKPEERRQKPRAEKGKRQRRQA
jgi:ribosomal protein S1